MADPDLRAALAAALIRTGMYIDTPGLDRPDVYADAILSDPDFAYVLVNAETLAAALEVQQAAFTEQPESFDSHAAVAAFLVTALRGPDR